MARRCLPRDRLPALGEWDGPIFGELGALAVDGDRVQCHACGLWYRSLASHAAQAHRLLADEYRALFGLNAMTGLVGQTLRARFAELAERAFAPYWPARAAQNRALTWEERSRRMRGRELRLEAKRNPANRRTWREAGAKGQASHVARLRDPAYRESWRRELSLARGGRVVVACVVCGAPFEVTPSLVRGGRGKTCGEACKRELRRRYLVARQSPEWRARARAGASAWGRRRGRQAAELYRGLPEQAWDGVPARDREILRLFYGLADGRTWTREEIGQRFGLTRTRIGQILRALRLRLLAAPAVEPAA